MGEGKGAMYVKVNALLCSEEATSLCELLSTHGKALKFRALVPHAGLEDVCWLHTSGRIQTVSRGDFP